MTFSMWAAVTILTASGMFEAWDVTVGFGLERDITQVQAHAAAVSTGGTQPGGGSLGTLIGMFLGVGAIFIKFIPFVISSPIMFVNLGVPAWLVMPITSVMYVITAFDVMHMWTGRQTMGV